MGAGGALWHTGGGGQEADRVLIVAIGVYCGNNLVIRHPGLWEAGSLQRRGSPSRFFTVRWAPRKAGVLEGQRVTAPVGQVDGDSAV